MPASSERETVRVLLERYPKSHAEALGIDLARNTPSPLYQWLIVSLLFSARISAGQAEKAARALFDKGWRTPKKMAETTWKQRVDVLNRAGYARYDESTSRYIEDATNLLLDRYRGDLRRLREEARQDPSRECELLTEFKGIGKVGAEIFLREAQRAWDEIYPFADEKALAVAGRLRLGSDAEELASLVRRQDLPRLLSALVRADLEGEVDTIRERAA